MQDLNVYRVHGPVVIVFEMSLPDIFDMFFVRVEVLPHAILRPVFYRQEKVKNSNQE